MIKYIDDYTTTYISPRRPLEMPCLQNFDLEVLYLAEAPAENALPASFWISRIFNLAEGAPGASSRLASVKPPNDEGDISSAKFTSAAELLISRF